MDEKIWVLLTYCLTFVHQPAAFLKTFSNKEIPGNASELLGITVTSWEIQRNPGKSREIQGNIGKYRAILVQSCVIQGYARKSREIRGNPEKYREIQGNPGKSRELQEKSKKILEKSCFDISMFSLYKISVHFFRSSVYLWTKIQIYYYVQYWRTKYILGAGHRVAR